MIPQEGRMQRNDEEKVVKDGGVVRVSMFAMDGVQRSVAAHKPGHKPGSIPLSDSDRQDRVARLAARDQVLSNRWKGRPQK
jgi:hypothetical protein